MAASFVIVGGGQAGAWVAKTLRRQDAGARIVLIGDESHAPYERPPLSKAVLKGQALPDSTTLLSREAAAALRVELRLGERVSAINRAAHRVRCAGGHEVEYTRLFLATGSRARAIPLPGIPADRVCALRTLDDARRLRGMLEHSQRVLVIGGGWVGLEVAAAARGMDVEVTVVEMGSRLCARAVPPVVSEFLLQLHRGHGVDVRLGVAARPAWDGTAIVADVGQGKPVTADLVVVGVGIAPNVELAAACGLVVDNGIVVDAHGCTSDPDICAVGDVAAHADPASGTHVRIESWHHAQQHAIAVARAALGDTTAYGEIPWFWSDQYDVNLQILGLPPAGVAPQLRGDPATGKCLWFFWRDGRIVSVIGINPGRDIKVVGKWMQDGRFPDPTVLADADVPLQKLARPDAAVARP